ncbi:MAG: methyltransferase [Anaerolineales bacterium]
MTLLDWTIPDKPTFGGADVVVHEVTILSHMFHIVGLADPAVMEQPDGCSFGLGLELWPTSIQLAERILSGERGRYRYALELGCGLGLVAAAASRAGWLVTAVDHEQSTIDFAALNAELNYANDVTFRLMDWQTPEAATLPGRYYSRIWASDVLYDEGDHEPVAKYIKDHLAADGCALIADPGRKVADAFPALARRHGFRVNVEAVA